MLPPKEAAGRRQGATGLWARRGIALYEGLDTISAGVQTNPSSLTVPLDGLLPTLLPAGRVRAGQGRSWGRVWAPCQPLQPCPLLTGRVCVAPCHSLWGASLVPIKFSTQYPHRKLLLVNSGTFISNRILRHLCL